MLILATDLKKSYLFNCTKMSLFHFDKKYSLQSSQNELAFDYFADSTGLFATNSTVS